MSRHDYEYLKPASVEEALRWRAETPGARFVAGGTDVFVQMCAANAEPPSALVSLRSIPELSAIEVGATAKARIGAMATVRDLADHAGLRESFPALVTAANRLASPQIRNVATIGGNLCNASPCADLPPPLLVYGARVEVRSLDGVRDFPLEELFVEPGRTSLREGEILTALLLDRPPPAVRAVYLRKGRVRMDLSMASAAVLVELDGGVCSRVRIAAGAVAPTPLRLREVEASLVGARLDEETARRAGEAAAAAVAPIDDVRASAWYRRRLIGVFVERALSRIAAGEHDTFPAGGDVAATESWQPGAADARRGAREISFELNGAPVTVAVAPGTRLIDLLRGALGQTGTKEGCSQGECGACTVSIDGRTVNSCLHAALEVDGRSVTTIEGVGCGREPTHLQRAFVEHGGVQCGFCTPGMILSARALLERSSDPEPGEITSALAGNLCRCTGYVQIFDSIRVAARRRREDGTT